MRVTTVMVSRQPSGSSVSVMPRIRSAYARSCLSPNSRHSARHSSARACAVARLPRSAAKTLSVCKALARPARQVLPTQPGPTRVSTRRSSRRGRASVAAASHSRPTSAVGARRCAPGRAVGSSGLSSPRGRRRGGGVARRQERHDDSDRHLPHCRRLDRGALGGERHARRDAATRRDPHAGARPELACSSTNEGTSWASRSLRPQSRASPGRRRLRPYEEDPIRRLPGAHTSGRPRQARLRRRGRGETRRALRPTGRRAAAWPCGPCG